MKYFIALSAVILAASAKPIEISDEAAALNSTLFDVRNTQPIGYASTGGGTYGGNGGQVWTVWDPWALRDAVAGNTPRIVQIQGRIDLTPLFVDSPGVILVVGEFKTIIGTNSNAEIYGGGLKTYYGKQVIIKNIKFTNALSYAPGEKPDGNGGIISMTPGAWSQVDAFDIEATDYVWVDHCEFSDDPWIAANIPNDQRRHDGQLDIKVGSSWITVSNNIFRNHNLVSLVGHSDANAAQDIGRLKITFVGNWFMGTIQRNPNVRYGEVHVLNNLYTDVRDYGIGVGAGASLYAERNAFINTRFSWNHPDGIPNPMGNLYHVNNHFVNTQFVAVPNAVFWNPSQYYHYTPIASMLVENSVKNNAGPK